EARGEIGGGFDQPAGGEQIGEQIGRQVAGPQAAAVQLVELPEPWFDAGEKQIHQRAVDTLGTEVEKRLDDQPGRRGHMGLRSPYELFDHLSCQYTDLRPAPSPKRLYQAARLQLATHVVHHL